VTKPTWKELEAQGIKRCCAYFTSGKQCRRRASEDTSEGFWCTKHLPFFKKVNDDFKAMMKATNGGNYSAPEGDDE